MVVLTRQAVTDLPTAAIALVTLGLLLRFKIGEPWIVAAAGALGLLLQWPWPPPHHARRTAKEHRMTWVTRARPKTDRIACPWLIRKFIDPGAEILYVLPDEVLGVAAREGAHSFEAPGATYTHRGSQCTFEVLIEEYNLAGDPALACLAAIVHAADIRTDLDTDPLGPGLLAIGEGGLDAEADDQRLLQRGSFVYDALYAWCQRQASTSEHAA